MEVAYPLGAPSMTIIERQRFDQVGMLCEDFAYLCRYDAIDLEARLHEISSGHRRFAVIKADSDERG